MSSNNLKQLGVAVKNYEDNRSSAPPAYGGVSPSAVTGLDPTGSAAQVQDIQFRQGGFNAATPPFGGFDAASMAQMQKASGPKPSQTNTNGFQFADDVRSAVGGQGLVGQSPNPLVGADNSVNTVALGTNYYAGGTVANGGTGAWTANSGSDRALPHAISIAGDGSGIAGPGPGIVMNNSNSAETARILTLKSNTSPSAMKTALLAVLGDQARAAGESGFNTESYDPLTDNQFLAVADNPLSTFSIDVDTASYSNIRRFLLQQNQLPPAGAVRIEELINYFHYEYPQPEGERPFSVTTEVASCPWQAEHRLVRIGLKGREIPPDKRPLSNLVFLIDVSGSMEEPNRLPLVQQSLKLLAEQLGENDHVAIVVYAGNSGLVLPSTRGDKRQEIIAAIERLRAGGSTNGGQGIELAYEIASRNFIKGGVNRVILATDGDFNVGITNQDDLVRLIQEKVKTGVFLTTLGFGFGNLKDSTMQKLADKGNGNNFYIDNLAEAQKVLVEQRGGTLVTIAKDVKIQIEFNPQEVAGYRLIGYEKRMLAKEDFNNDKIDAGEIGAGHTVTALYEVVPTKGVRGQESGVSNLAPGSAGGPGAEGGPNSEGGIRKAEDGTKSDDALPVVDPLKYVKPAELTDAAKSGDLFTLKLRYKQPDGDKSALIETPVKDAGKKYGEASADFKFAAAVASFGMILRDSQFKGNSTLAAVQELAAEGLQHRDGEPNGKDHANDTEERQRRGEFIQLVERAKSLKGP